MFLYPYILPPPPPPLSPHNPIWRWRLLEVGVKQVLPEPVVVALEGAEPGDVMHQLVDGGHLLVQEVVL